MRGCSRVAFLWMVASAAGCDREPRPEVGADEAQAQEKPAGEVEAAPEPRPETPTSAREAERERIEGKVGREHEQAVRATEAAANPEPEPAPMSRGEPELRVLPAPPFAYTLRAEAPVKHQGPMPTLRVVSNERNRVIDEESWFRDNKLALPLFTLPLGPSAPTPPRAVRSLGMFKRRAPAAVTKPVAPLGGSGELLPPEIPDTFGGHRILQGIRGTDATIAIHGPDSTTVVVYDALGTALGAFDFGSYGRAMDVRWADVQDGVLYACTSNLFYAKDSGGLNAFLTAIELGSGELLWQSEPLVCNVHSFLLRDGWILTGYGYTAEPDVLFVLDMKTGATVQRVPIKSGPEWIIEKRGKLFVRTYDRNYVFAVR